MEDTAKENEKREKGSAWKEIWEFLRTLLIEVVVLFLFIHFIARPIRVDGNSMYPTLVSDSLGFSNVIGRTTSGLKRFDIAIIYVEDKKEYLVKRVIALPGETVSYKDAQLYINDQPVEEDFLDPSYRENWGISWMPDVVPLTLGEGEYYCLGDNRPNSRDSRYYGPFQSPQIVAKGAFIFWPFDEFGVKNW